MFSYFVFLIVLVCKVHSQPCGPVILPPVPAFPPPCLPPPCLPTPCPPPPCLPAPCPPPPCLPAPCPPSPCLPAPCPPPPCLPAPCPPPPCLPNNPPCVQVVNPNPQVTTIIDNTVSNALVNALQLLIVSNLLGSSGAPVIAPKPLQNNLGPLLESLVFPVPCNPVEIGIPECQPYPTLEVIPPCAPVVNCCPNIEFIRPCAPVIENIPPPFCGLTEIISPNFFTYTETITPFFGTCYETLPPNICNTETIYPVYNIEGLGPNFCGGLTEIVTPNYCPFSEIGPYCGGFAETVSPTIAALAPNMFGGFTEVLTPNLLQFPLYGGLPEGCPFGPLPTLTPNYFGGLTEVVSQVPLAAELVFPSAIPAQLTCNFGYTPSSLPCVRVNVEPLPYDPCNGFGNPFYY